MNSKFRLLIVAFFFFGYRVALAQYTIGQADAIPLHGEWSFALDPANMGINGKWYSDQLDKNTRFDKVTVPHCFSTDPRFQFFTGTVWYRKPFVWKSSPRKRIILHFDAVFYKSSVWLNNQKVGQHEGGYTPFSFDITDFLKEGDNLLALSVSNDTWQPGTIPGAKDNNRVNDPFNGWMNYGGLVRPVYLTVKPEVYAENLKIEATPDLQKGTASLKTKLRIRNASQKVVSPKTALGITLEGKNIPLNWKHHNPVISPGQTLVIESEATLTAAQVKLWNLDSPHLYQLTAVTGSDTIRSHFGIRKVEVKNAQLLLNGKPMRLAGGNRVVDHPGLGSLEPDWLVEKDFRLMKEAGMEFQRLTHYTPSENFYNLADRYGMLIITEAGNWQLTPRQMENDTIRAHFRQQFKEMVERDWNHPSVIAYSVGNEYLSELPEGQRWTKDMIEYARELDPTRLYTFASMRLNILPAKPEDEASQYVDIVCANIYGGHAKALDHIHKLYPDKPILVSEWGVRADDKTEFWYEKPRTDVHHFNESEVSQARHVSDVVSEVRKRPFVVGASWWSYNDYQSRHFLSNPNGYRPWGIVRPDRSLRPAYQTYQKEMAVLTIEKTSFTTGTEGIHQLKILIRSRADFPAYETSGYILEAGNSKFSIPAMKPGESKELNIPVKGFDKNIVLKIYKPTGFLVTETRTELK